MTTEEQLGEECLRVAEHTTQNWVYVPDMGSILEFLLPNSGDRG